MDGLKYRSDDEQAEPANDAGGDDFTKAVKEAFPDNAWDATRVAAFKEAIKLCTESDYSGDDEDSEAGPPKAASPALALLFGKKK